MSTYAYAYAYSTVHSFLLSADKVFESLVVQNIPEFKYFYVINLNNGTARR